jgi:tetrahydromethanopterin S-methyltransferase subunit G
MKLLKKYWNEKEEGPDFSLEEQAQEILQKRTRDFGITYQNIVLEMTFV